MPPSGTQQVTKERRDSHAGESTSFAGAAPQLSTGGSQAALVLVPEDDEDPLDDEPFEEDEPLEEDEDDEEESDDDDELDDEDDSAFAGTELLADDRLSVR